MYNNYTKHTKKPKSHYTFADIVSLIGRKTNFQPRLYGDRVSCLCPAHEDSKPSLSMKRAPNGVTLIKCYVGCPIDEICMAAGIRVADLFTQN